MSRYRCIVVLLVLSASATAVSAKGVEELAWDYRFVPTAHHDSPLLGPLQRALVGMHNHLSSAGKDKHLCEDECGMVQRLDFWGEPREGLDVMDIEDIEPETWGPLNRNKSLYAGKYCRLHRTLQPLYDTCLRVNPERGGYAFWYDYMGNFWRGMDTVACVESVNRSWKPDSRLADVNETCHADSSRFTAYEQRWLDIARPLIANELRKLSGGQELASEANSGAASLDRLLLLLARLTCLAQNAGEGADAPSTSSSQKGSEGGHVLVVGAGPVGLMTALQARLSGMRVTVWERRSLQERTRDNVVDAAESDRSDPEHPAALTLFENIGLFYLGMSGMWVRPRFLRGTALRTSQYNHALYKKDEETEWELLHSIKHLEHALQKICLIVGVHLQQVELRGWEVESRGEAGYSAVGRGAGGAEVRLPVNVLVGADGDNSRVRDLANISLMLPRVRLRMPQHCQAMANDRLVAESEMLESEKVEKQAEKQEVVPSEHRQAARLSHFSTFHVSSDCAEITTDEEHRKQRQQLLGARAAAAPPPPPRASRGGGGAGDEADEAVFYVWSPELVSVQITVHSNCGVREHDPLTHALSNLVATLFEDQSRPGRCQITLGLEASYGRLVLAGRRGQAGPGVSHDALQKLVLYICSSLLGYGKEAVAAAVAAGSRQGAQASGHSARASAGGASLRDEDAWQGWYAGHLKVFSNDFRFAETTAVVLREGEARILVALEGDAARQPYYREGNGLNVGLYGAVDLARLLPFVASAEAVAHRALRRRRALGAAMSQIVLEDSIRLSAIETLIPSRETESMLRRVVVWGDTREDAIGGWSDYEWRDMRSQDRILWETLGWNEERWEGESWIDNEGDSTSVGGYGSSRGRGSLDVFCPLAEPHGFRSFQDLTQAQKDAVRKLRIDPERRGDMWRLCEPRVWRARMSRNGAPSTFVLLVFLLLALPALALFIACANLLPHLRPKPSNKLYTRGFKAAEPASRPSSQCTSTQHQDARLLASKLADHKSNAGIKED